MGQIECAVCEKHFSRPSTLKRHMASSCIERSERLRCEICAQTFSRKDLLQRHQRHHSGEYLVACRLCRRTFRRDYLARHENQCREKLKTAYRKRALIRSELHDQSLLPPLLACEIRWQRSETRLESPLAAETQLTATDTNKERRVKFVEEITSGADSTEILAVDLEHAVGNSDSDMVTELLESMEKSNLSIAQIDDIPSALGGHDKDLTLLMLACCRNSTVIVQDLLTVDQDVDRRNNAVGTALHYACKTGNVEAAQLLLDGGASVDSRSIRGSTPLHTAASIGDLPVARLLLKSGARVNGIESDLPPLHGACFSGHLSMVSYLIRDGADVNYGRLLPLEIAIRHGSLDVTELLLLAGARPDLVRECFLRELMHRDRATYNDSDWGKMKLINRYWPGKRGPYGQISSETGVGDRSVHITDQDVSTNDQPVREPQIQAEAANAIASTPVSYEDLQEMTYAIQEGNMGRLQVLFQVYGNDVGTLCNACDYHNEYPMLHTAAFWNSVEVPKYLLDLGFQPDILDGSENTALHIACDKGHETICQLLLRCGADKELYDREGRTALARAAKSGELVCLRQLILAGADVNNFEEVEDQFWSRADTPLQLACGKDDDHGQIVKDLLAAGADVNLGKPSPLKCALYSSSIDIVCLLMDYGADRSALSDDELETLVRRLQKENVSDELLQNRIASLIADHFSEYFFVEQTLNPRAREAAAAVGP